ncbi:MAG: RDD family protein [Gemmataceae bacterium]
MIRTTCPQCGREDAIAEYLASLPVLCKQCGQRVTMGEVLAPTRPPPPPAAKAPPPPLPPPAPPKVVAPPPPPPAALPKPAPAPVVVEAPPEEAPSPDPPVHTNGTVVPPRPAFTKAVGPGVADLFEDAPGSEQRAARLPHLPVPPPPVAPVGVNFHRGRRLAARLVTLVGAVVAVAAGILLVGFAPGVVKNDGLMSTIFLLVPLGLYALYNVVLLGTQGQDFGKRALKLRVVGDDGTPARFARAFLKRELVVILLLAGLIPLGWKLYKFQQAGTLPEQWQRVGANLLMPEALPAADAVLFSLLNAALIFGRDGKCLHDKLAKTRVERAGN